MIRWLKIILVIFVGLNGLFYFAANIANWEVARGAVGATIAMGERPWYPVALVPPLEGTAAATVALVVILTGELLVGVLSLAGAWRLIGAADKPAEAFNGAKSLAIAGCAMALVVWFGGFTAIGGALFQMWQTELGQASLGDAHKFLVGSGIVLLWLSMRDE
ncbi:DUF2165 family protein [Amphiplicatus metriothermophilus]|uniref:Predicted small integral membrane protein n=1 Tax=Amphiplicatus metriothermophilus TaxID=1519374 RepID=A0A239PJT6_9PROT|nr:DUF2165 family protein [Amphiplicatus metriothermophilus]MBB5518077.1 putative small integral membrane protein [Amphiplicatus metriothermophilus]SNT67589.1 Predicted small integral membrane protein [Amphiplicatus metriothermophilus]